MKQFATAAFTTFVLVLAPASVLAQNVNVTRSILPDLPFTVIYPEPMIASGGADGPLTINHPQAPLQCEMQVVPTEDSGWSADNALASLDDAAIAASWAEIMPDFTMGNKGTTPYQDATALIYEGNSTQSSMGVPLTLVHTETVANGRGYMLDCYYATDQAQNARPIVDFIILNFATRADADCCVGATTVPDSEAVPSQ